MLISLAAIVLACVIAHGLTSAGLWLASKAGRLAPTATAVVYLVALGLGYLLPFVVINGLVSLVRDEA